jgi:Thoeris protein ThsB, TIR-like domain
MARRAFFSFHYKPDNWRAATVRNIGALEGNLPASDNDWEAVTKSGDDTIKKWIADQMYGRSCTVVLVGKDTANRKWINHEIVESWNNKMGVVGIYIHGLKDVDQNTTTQGANPFDFLSFSSNGKKLSAVVKCYSPSGSNSKERYDWIVRNLKNAVEEAVKIRAQS